VRAVHQARRDDVETDLIDAYDQIGVTALRVYEQFGRRVFTLVNEVSVDALDLLLRYPQAFQGLLRYGKLAYRFVCEFEKPAVDKLVELEQDDLSNALSDEAWSVLQAWHQSYYDLDVVNDLVKNWRLMPYIHRAGLRPILVRRALAKIHGDQAMDWLAGHADMLLNKTYDYTLLVSMVGRVEPQLLESVVGRYYDELEEYRDPAERIRFCNLFAGRLEIERDGKRYVQLCTTVDRVNLLPIAEVVGPPVLDLLEALKPRARVEAARFMQRLSRRAIPAFVSEMLAWFHLFADWPDAMQVKLILSCQHQPLRSVLSAWSDYGEDALDEIAKHKKIRWLFKLTHRKRG
jgi:hypothetical protein